MTLQCVYGATVAVFAFGVVSVGPAYAQRRDGALLPQDQSGEVTAAGCLVRGTAVRGGPKDKYVLARPKRGPVANVPEAACTASTGDDALTLDNTSAAGINDKMLGRWVEITGRLERETSKDPGRRASTAGATGHATSGRAAGSHPAAGTGGDASTGSGTSPCTCSGTRRASQDSAEDGEPPSGDWFCRVALAGDGPHASFVPSPATRLRH